MATTVPNPLSTVIGVFPDHDQADRTIDELRRTKFSYDRIRLVERGTGGFFDNLKSMFTGQAEMVSSTADQLVKMGLPEYEAQHYQQELDSGHVLVLMNADDRPEEAFDIMRQNGAFDINSRLKTPAPNGSSETYPVQRPDLEHSPNGSQAPSEPAPNEAPDTSDEQALA